MDTDLKELFNEKNQSLFFNKLLMDVDNNTDTFKFATKNIIIIEFAKLLSSLRKLYNKYTVEINEDKVKEILSSSKKTILTDVNILIDKKNQQTKQYIEESDGSSINGKYVKNYCKHVDALEEDFEKTLKLAVLELSEVYLYTKLTNLYPCVNEEMQHELLLKTNVDFSNILISRIIAESIHRNMTLKNISEETYKNYLNLNRNSAKIDKNSKVKIIKNN